MRYPKCEESGHDVGQGLSITTVELADSAEDECERYVLIEV